MKHTIDDIKTVNPEFRLLHNRIGLFNSHFQNFKQFGIPKAQLILTDIPYNIGKNAYGSNLSWVARLTDSRLRRAFIRMLARR